jgi:hypothetical protein
MKHLTWMISLGLKGSLAIEQGARSMTKKGLDFMGRLADNIYAIGRAAFVARRGLTSPGRLFFSVPQVTECIYSI